MTKPRDHVADLRGASRLALDATTGVVDVVEAMHHTIASGPEVLGRPLAAPAGIVTRIVYGAIRGVTQLVGTGLEVALASLAPLLGAGAPGPEREALVAALNGVVGDHLHATGNPLAIPMRLRHGGAPLALEREALRAAFPQAGGKILVLVHGSCMNDRQWCRNGHDHGAALARDGAYTPVYVHYNTGLHISTNGRELAALLERLVAAWPAPVDELAILGHSMGGLVARSACHTAEAEAHAWRGALRRLVFLGSPHHGAPWERGGNLIDLLLGISRYSAPLGRLGRLRSAGVTDMRYGNVLDEHWRARDRFAPGADPRREVKLPAGVACYAVAGTTAREPRSRLPGDGVVPLDSALGRHARPELALGFPETHQLVGFGVGHFDLLDRAEVYEALRRWLAP
ncbi:MAG TPA: alpha/beta hydrolase [Polyangia bacterium]